MPQPKDKGLIEEIKKEFLKYFRDKNPEGSWYNWGSDNVKLIEIVLSKSNKQIEELNGNKIYTYN